jgi:hypothetical protein
MNRAYSSRLAVLPLRQLVCHPEVFGQGFDCQAESINWRLQQ